MQTTITAKLKLMTTPEQFAALRQTQLAYRDALNQASQHAFAQGKTSNSQRLHRDLYEETRATHGLPVADGLQCVPTGGRHLQRPVDQVVSRTWRRAKPGGRRNAFKGLEKPPHYVSPTLTYVYGRDYTFKAAGQVSVLTLVWPSVLPYQGWSRHVARLQPGSNDRRSQTLV